MGTTQLCPTPGVEKATCQGDDCVVMFDPALWRQADYELKGNITAALGLALAFGKHAKYVEIHDNQTNKTLGSYDVRADKTRVY